MSTVIAWVSLAVSVGVAVWVHRRQHGLQARMVALEEAREKDRLLEQTKARLTAQLESEVLAQRRHESPRRHFLRIENKGLSEARDIDVVLDGNPVLEHPAVPRGQPEVRQVGSLSGFNYLLAPPFKNPFPRVAEITWSDDSGEPGSYRTTLTP